MIPSYICMLRGGGHKDRLILGVHWQASIAEPVSSRPVIDPVSTNTSTEADLWPRRTYARTHMQCTHMHRRHAQAHCALILDFISEIIPITLHSVLITHSLCELLAEATSAEATSQSHQGYDMDRNRIPRGSKKCLQPDPRVCSEEASASGMERTIWT